MLDLLHQTTIVGHEDSPVAAAMTSCIQHQHAYAEQKELGLTTARMGDKLSWSLMWQTMGYMMRLKHQEDEYLGRGLYSSAHGCYYQASTLDQGWLEMAPPPADELILTLQSNIYLYFGISLACNTAIAYLALFAAMRRFEKSKHISTARNAQMKTLRTLARGAVCVAPFRWAIHKEYFPPLLQNEITFLAQVKLMEGNVVHNPRDIGFHIADGRMRNRDVRVLGEEASYRWCFSGSFVSGFSPQNHEPSISNAFTRAKKKTNIFPVKQARDTDSANINTLFTAQSSSPSTRHVEGEGMYSSYDTACATKKNAQPALMEQLVRLPSPQRYIAAAQWI